MARKGLSPPEEGQSELEQMFAIFDRDGDGFITHTEMKRALGKCWQCSHLFLLNCRLDRYSYPICWVHLRLCMRKSVKYASHVLKVRVYFPDRKFITDYAPFERLATVFTIERHGVSLVRSMTLTQKSMSHFDRMSYHIWT
ncbi:hypothetical protein DPMN_095512 [Dreissena polymorpha]|uniref:EF-hand domain-containing protein n=1 Tax=Dreissena polymorpha TaxID=45954 RepID=A0A9D4R4J6_DREPO|nr:hypothetical protein DPMN_095512 [Dreissena polymorpha]